MKQVQEMTVEVPEVAAAVQEKEQPDSSTNGVEKQSSKKTLSLFTDDIEIKSEVEKTIHDDDATHELIQSGSGFSASCSKRFLIKNKQNNF